MDTSQQKQLKGSELRAEAQRLLLKAELLERNETNQLDRVVNGLDLTSKLFPHRNEFHIGENCQTVIVNGIEITELIKQCHKSTQGECLKDVLARFLQDAN